MNNIEKTGVIIAGILIIVGIAYYALPNISGSSAFEFRPESSPLLESSGSLVCNIYVQDDAKAGPFGPGKGDDNNDGLTVDTPVRSLRVAFEKANLECEEMAEIKIMNNPNWPFVGYIAVNSDDYSAGEGPIEVVGPKRIKLTSQYPGEKENMAKIMTGLYDSQVHNIGISVNPNGFGSVEKLEVDSTVFYEIGLKIFNNNNEAVIDNNYFYNSLANMIYEDNTSLLSIANFGKSFTQVKGNLIGNYDMIGYKLISDGIYIENLDESSMVVEENTFWLPRKQYYDEQNPPDFYDDIRASGIRIVNSESDNGISIVNNIFESHLNAGDPPVVRSYSEMKMHIIGIFITAPADRIIVSDNKFSEFNGLDVVGYAVSHGSQNINVLNNAG